MAADHEQTPATGFPEPPDNHPEDRTRDRDPHHDLNTPIGEPDPTEWPDPYDHREDPRDPTHGKDMTFGEQPHTTPGAESTSAPNPKQDPEAQPWAEGPKRDKLDE